MLGESRIKKHLHQVMVAWISDKVPLNLGSQFGENRQSKDFVSHRPPFKATPPKHIISLLALAIDRPSHLEQSFPTTQSLGKTEILIGSQNKYI